MDAGVARCAEERVLRCFDARDAGCAHHPTRACGAWVVVPDGLTAEQEDEGAVVCGACGVEHAPLRDGRTMHMRMAVSVVEDGVEAWMDAAVRRLDPSARRLRQGVAWQLALADADVELVWLDRSASTPLASRAYAAARAVVYVVTASRTWSTRFRDDPWLAPVPLGEWIARGDDAVHDALARRAEPPLVREPAMRTWSPNRRVEERAVVVPLGARALVVGADRATLDGQEVIGRDGTAILALLRLLVERWRDDLAAGKEPAAHCTWTPEELAADLGAQPATVRRQLVRLRAGVVERYQQATGVRLPDDEVVENIEGQGYRLNPTRVLARLA